MFLFGCYTGVSYADVISITDENLYTDDNGALWLKYRRKKNEHRASVKLLPEAIALIESITVRTGTHCSLYYAGLILEDT